MVALPQFVQIEPVGQCNLRCAMCPVQFRAESEHGGAPAFMQLDHFMRLVDEFRMNELHLQGLGEPLMHPQFFDMVAYAVRRGIRVSTNTNMTLMTPHRADRTVASGLDALYASIDGAKPATYAAIRRGGHLGKVLRNLDRVIAARARHGASRPAIHIVMVLMRCNLAELPDMVELTALAGADGLSVQRLCHDFAESSLPRRYKPMRAFVDEQMLTGDDLPRMESFFAAAREAAARHRLPLRLPRTAERVEDRGRPRCDWPWRGAYVSCRGEAMPCCMVSTPDRINFGNMAQDGVRAVWNSEAYDRFREQLAGDRPPEICSSCSVYRGVF